jgi:hypothetical protein
VDEEVDMAAGRRHAGPTFASPFADGASVGIGGLPHRDPSAAAAFAIGEFDVATVPSLPRLDELMIAQALDGLAGVSVGADGDVVLGGRLTRDVEVPTELSSRRFEALRVFLDLAATIRFDGAAVKWQFVGPITLGVALERAGVARRHAYDVADRVVRSRLTAISTAIAATLPSSPQMVLLDEPVLGDLMDPAFPLAPDDAIDRLSGAMATLPATTVSGVHCCVPFDLATVIASGPAVISMPVAPDVTDWAGYVSRFLDDGGLVVWGVVATDGPVPTTSDRAWRELSDLWCSLVQAGCDPVQLRRRSLVSPQCGLGSFSVSVARRIARLTGDVGKRVKDQSSATRLALGA